VTRVLVVVEGQTEETFINDLLASVFWRRNVFLKAVLVGVPGHKGGNPKYARVKRDVLTILKQDAAVYCSTMIDLYGLGHDFPGMPPAAGLGGLQIAMRIEEGIQKDISECAPGLRAEARFLPYIQVHEYESLLFSDPNAFAAALNSPPLARRFQQIRARYDTPEDINDSTETAPSKRILSLFPGYEKRIQGALAARAVGIEAMRRECPHFGAWLERLEQIPSVQ
jgi:hypothetical protein